LEKISKDFKLSQKVKNRKKIPQIKSLEGEILEYQNFEFVVFCDPKDTSKSSAS
jgi:hypothetical protein